MILKKIGLIIFTLCLFTLAVYVFVHMSPQEQSPQELPPVSSYQKPDPLPQETKPIKKTTPAPELPAELLLSVPFTPQAPTANWDELHNEACEEASVLMANAFFNGDTRSTLSPQEAEEEITKLTEWQQKNLGYYLSIDSEETVRMIESVYGLQAEVVRDFSEDTIKQALVQQKLVLVPVNGRLLGNPYFQQPGPIYHMFVIKGYDATSFIVNEPGTKRGRDYRYTWEVLKGSIGDYNHETKETDPSKPAIIIVSK